MMLCSLRAEREVVTVTRAGLGTGCWQPHKLLQLATASHRMPSEAYQNYHALGQVYKCVTLRQGS